MPTGAWAHITAQAPHTTSDPGSEGGKSGENTGLVQAKPGLQRMSAEWLPGAGDLSGLSSSAQMRTSVYTNAHRHTQKHTHEGEEEQSHMKTLPVPHLGSDYIELPVRVKVTFSPLLEL